MGRLLMLLRLLVDQSYLNKMTKNNNLLNFMVSIMQFISVNLKPVQ